MDMLKKHFEKILLGGVLLILTVGAAMLPVKIASERDELKQKADEIINRPAKPLEPLNMSAEEACLQRLRAGYRLDLATSNKVFNPTIWQETSDGRLIKIQTGREVGIEAVTVTELTSLYLNVTFDSVREAGTNYVISVERQASSNVSLRRKKVYYSTVNNKNDVFILREVRGAIDNPTELVIELTDSSERVVISKEKPFKRVDGYMVDLKYDPEKKTWADQRIGATIRVGGEDYNIVAISKTEVVVLAKSNQKKTPIKISPDLSNLTSN